MLGFLDKYEEQAVDLKIKIFEAGEKKKLLQQELEEVCHCGALWGWGGGQCEWCVPAG